MGVGWGEVFQLFVNSLKVEISENIRATRKKKMKPGLKKTKGMPIKLRKPKLGDSPKTQLANLPEQFENSHVRPQPHLV